MAVLIDMKEKS